MRAIALGPSLIGYLDNQNYSDFIHQWRKATGNPSAN
jgi:iron(III) transport system substrate-binding protein